MAEPVEANGALFLIYRLPDGSWAYTLSLRRATTSAIWGQMAMGVRQARDKAFHTALIGGRLDQG
ncbi:MAG: hypothetical protein R2867_33315 [Caldilineaceae bacterium]